MSLTEQDIKKYTTIAAFRKGKALFGEGGVTQFLLDRDIEQGIVYLNGKVLGKEEPYYEVSVDLDTHRNYEVISSRCHCHAYRNIDGHCKHIVALLMRYIEETNTKEKEYPIVTEFIEFLEDVEKIKKKKEQQELQDGRKEETPEEQLRRLLGLGTVKKGMEPKKKHTDRTVSHILERLTQDLQYQTYKNKNKQIEIEPTLRRMKNGKNYVLSFGVGEKKKYVIKSIEDFISWVSAGEYMEYGKNLAFLHTREVFTEASLPYLDFMQEYVQIRGRGWERSFFVEPNTKEISLNGLLFERFMLAVEESHKRRYGDPQGTIEISAGNKDVFILQRNNPEMTVVIQQTDEGATLKFPSFECIIGTTQMFLVKKNTIYHCKEKFSREMRIILEQIKEGGNCELFVQEEDLQSVCGTMIPILARHVTLEEKNFSVEDHEPPQAEIFIYLDEDREIGVTCRVECKYGEQRFRIFEETGKHVYRDVVKETAVTQLVGKYFIMARRKNSDFMLLEEDKLYQLLLEGIDEFNQVANVYATEAFRKNEIRQTPGVDFGVSIKSDLLDLSVQSEQLPYEELDEILESYKLKKRYHRLKNGQFLELEASSLSILSELASGLQITGKDLKRGTMKIPKHRALYIDSVLREAGEQVHVHRDHLFKGLVRNIKNVEDSDYDVPTQQYSVLRSYQKKGYRWMRTIRDYGFGGILADDMGLGKTLQVITLFQAVKEQWEDQERAGNMQMALVVCPASLVYNWESEIRKFAPNLTTVIVNGGAGVRKDLILNTEGADVWITSYDLLKRDVEWYQGVHFDLHVIDEAQYIKNASTQAAKAVKLISSNTRFALTGTPIENRLSELWSIFDFLMPGFLFTYKKFKEDIESEILAGVNEEKEQDGKALERLRTMVRPFVLRRMKEEVLKDLPKKIDSVIFSKMEGEQQRLYDARVLHLKRSLEQQTNEEYKKNKIEILSELTRLRQICCDPALCYEDYKGPSAKLEACMELVEDAVGGGHKVLLFSQFTTMLKKIAKELKKRKIQFYELTGETSKEKRVEMAKNFNEDHVPVFLISLKAGGTGLNLVGADIVIHFDPWWNVAAQNQATDRAHRIGQHQVVTVFQMIAAKTIEEKIVALQEKKKNLADQIISGEGMSDASFSREELLEILEQS